MKLGILTLVVMCLVAVQGFGAPLSPVQKRAELESLATLVATQYGPLEYKQRLLKMDLDTLVDQYAKEAEPLDNTAFYYLVNRFVAEFKDSHFSSRLDTSFITHLGFVCDLVDGRVLIDQIDRSKLSRGAFPFERGDEIVTFDGKPVLDAVQDVARYRGHGNPDTTLRAGTMALTYRQAHTAPPQSGTLVLEIRRGTSSLIDTVELTWQQQGEPLLETATWGHPSTDYGDLSIQDFVEELPPIGARYQCSGTSRVERPKGATVIMETPFVAYYHATDKGNIGYLRIPHYSWSNAAGESVNDLRLLQYEYAVSELEKNTVGLIIDQDHNCGGSVSLLEKMVSLFTDKPFDGLQFQFLASRGEYLEFKRWMGEDNKKTINGQQWLGVLDLIKTSWLKGDALTPKTTFNGTVPVSPNPVHYTKPIVVLTDEMSGSGGDAFPAMMQGLGLAKIMGSRTMGAGGHVVATSPLYYSSNKVRLTKSLFFHPNGTAIENNGVTPDISYRPTRTDFLYGYREYQKRYLEELFKLIP